MLNYSKIFPGVCQYIFPWELRKIEKEQKTDIGSEGMMTKYAVRTDLAVESKEKFEKDQVEIEGVVIHETYDRQRDIRTTVVSVESEK